MNPLRIKPPTSAGLHLTTVKQNLHCKAVKAFEAPIFNNLFTVTSTYATCVSYDSIFQTTHNSQ